MGLQWCKMPSVADKTGMINIKVNGYVPKDDGLEPIGLQVVYLISSNTFE